MKEESKCFSMFELLDSIKRKYHKINLKGVMK